MKARAFGVAFAIFLVVLPIPGTIAPRNLLLLVLLLLMLSSWKELRQILAPTSSTLPALAGWLLVLSLWILVQALWFSDETAWALKEIRSQWIAALLSGVVGAGAILFARLVGISRRQILGGLALLLLAQTIFSLACGMPHFLESGSFFDGKTRFVAGKLEISYWNNVLLAFLAVDVLTRWFGQARLTFIPTPLLLGGIFAVFLSNLAYGARNGVIGSVLLIFSLLLLVFLYERKRHSNSKVMAVILAAFVLAGSLLWSNFKLDPRWAKFQETARIAWQIDASDAWLRPDGAAMPQLGSGEPVEESAYMRIAWIHAGMRMIEAYPMGVGYGRNAFGHALRKTMETRLGHAHSGLIDWTVGVGVPGLLLWLGFITWLGWLGIKRYFSRQDPAGLILTFVAGGFFGRMLLDSINRDHMLMLFFLVFTILVTLPEDAGVE